MIPIIADRKANAIKKPGRRQFPVASRQHRPEPRAELAEVEAVDDAVAVEVEVAQIVRIAGLRSEGVPEEAEVEAVDGLIAVDVAEEAEEALRVAEDEVAAGRAVAVAVECLRRRR